MVAARLGPLICTTDPVAVGGKQAEIRVDQVRVGRWVASSVKTGCGSSSSTIGLIGTSLASKASTATRSCGILLEHPGNAESYTACVHPCKCMLDPFHDRGVLLRVLGCNVCAPIFAVDLIMHMPVLAHYQLKSEISVHRPGLSFASNADARLHPLAALSSHFVVMLSSYAPVQPAWQHGLCPGMVGRL